MSKWRLNIFTQILVIFSWNRFQFKEILREYKSLPSYRKLWNRKMASNWVLNVSMKILKYFREINFLSRTSFNFSTLWNSLFAVLFKRNMRKDSFVSQKLHSISNIFRWHPGRNLISQNFCLKKLKLWGRNIWFMVLDICPRDHMLLSTLQFEFSLQLFWRKIPYHFHNISKLRKSKKGKKFREIKTMPFLYIKKRTYLRTKN